MNLNYEKVKNNFDEYIEECRDKIKNTFFKEDYLKGLNYIKNNLIKEGKIEEDCPLDRALMIQRLNMIDVKIDHTMRIVEDVTKIALSMGTNIDFDNVLKVSALLHDIGRFDQATWSNSFADGESYKNYPKQTLGKNIKNHAHAGYGILFDENKIDEFEIDKKYYGAIGQVVYNHGNPTLEGDLSLKLNDVNDLDVNKLSGNYNLNNDEKIIVATLVQMVKDVDMLDILYQNISGEFPIIRDSFGYDVENETIDKIAAHFEVEPNVLLEYNKIEPEDLKNMAIINIPVKAIDLKKMIVPQDIQEKFYNNERLDLRELQKRRDWTFITGMWWRLNHFLNEISFTTNLQLVQEKQVLDMIYAKYPDEYKFLVKDAFEFAKEKLINNVLSLSEGNMYVTKIR